MGSPLGPLMANMLSCLNLKLNGKIVTYYPPSTGDTLMTRWQYLNPELVAKSSFRYSTSLHTPVGFTMELPSFANVKQRTL